MWGGDLTTKDGTWLNNRVISSEQVKCILDEFSDLDAVLICPNNKERNITSAENYKQRVLNTYPSSHGLSEPSKHTLVVKTNISLSKNTKNGPKQHTIGGALRHRIFTTCS